ncbi:hypothetical protein PspLS_10054 [Pyricularia sp. CBS 133598]|nr:hypothetical protein PspLS_10054 [Pyricularia sp. CBS 133598]
MDSNVDDGANVSGSTTEPIPSTEFARMLEEYGVRLASPEAPSCSTNPFSLNELIRRYGEKNAASPVSQEEGEDEAEGAPNVRIILGALPIRLHPLGHIEPGVDAKAWYRRAVLDVAAKAGGTALPGALSYQKLFLTQSKENVGLTIQTLAYVPSTQAGQRVPTAESPAQLLYCILVFDPAADRIAIKNVDDNPVTLKMFRRNLPTKEGLEGQAAFTTQSVRSIEIGPYDYELLKAGPWAIHTASGQQILEFSVLARSGISVFTNSQKPRTAKILSQGAKRQHDFSQTEDPGPAKKGKLREFGSKDNAIIVFQPAPIRALHQARGYPAVMGPSASASATSTRRDLLPINVHPMQYFHAGDKAKVIGPAGKDYTVTYDKEIAMRANCHVFSGQHFSFPKNNGAAVIKVIRSLSGPVEEGGFGKIAQAIYRSGHVWVQEVKNHSRLSEQLSVVRLFDADSRVFALYMEHVEAPSLVYYIQPNAAGPYCTLTRTNATEVLRNMSTAISYIYRQKIVHNDIKPDNIFYFPIRGAVLIDFGLLTEITGRSSGLYTAGFP